MSRHKTVLVPREPYNGSPDISIVEFYFKDELISPGTSIRIKNDRRTYTFVRMCVNTRLNKEWLDLRSDNGDWKSVYPSKIKGVVQRKRSYKKK